MWAHVALYLTFPKICFDVFNNSFLYVSGLPKLPLSSHSTVYDEPDGPIACIQEDGIFVQQDAFLVILIPGATTVRRVKYSHCFHYSLLLMLFE